MQAWIQKILQPIADKYYLKDIQQIVQTTSPIQSVSYPRLFYNLQYCCQTLHITDIPTIYVTPRVTSINALSVSYQKETLILLSPQATTLTDLEQRFILGHELGHCQQGNLVAHIVLGLLDSVNNLSESVGPLIEDAVNVPLKNWFRSTEFEADKAGYLCAPDINMVHTLFTKLGMKEQITAFESYAEIDATHPLLLTRYNELKKHIAL